jgi:drug/metabolite transporter (DMT)-like permease
VITYINPLVALVLGVLLLDEPLTAGMLVGFALVLLGSFFATARRGDPDAHAHPGPRNAERPEAVPPG